MPLSRDGPFLSGLLSLAKLSDSRKSSGDSKLISFHRLLRPLCSWEHKLEALDIALCPCPECVPRHDSISEVYREFPERNGLVFALICSVDCGTLYTHGCEILNFVQSLLSISQVLDTCQG